MDCIKKNTQIQREFNDVPCGRTLDDYFNRKIIIMLNILYNNYNVITYDIKEYYINLIIKINHNNFVEAQQFEIHNDINLDARIKYILNEINENEFKKIIESNNTKNQIKNEIRNVFNLVYTTMCEIIYVIYDMLTNFNDVNITVINLYDKQNEIKEFIYYCNNLLEEISYTYKSKKYYFDENLNFKIYSSTASASV